MCFFSCNKLGPRKFFVILILVIHISLFRDVTSQLQNNNEKSKKSSSVQSNTNELSDDIKNFDDPESAENYLRELLGVDAIHGKFVLSQKDFKEEESLNKEAKTVHAKSSTNQKTIHTKLSFDTESERKVSENSANQNSKAESQSNIWLENALSTLGMGENVADRENILRVLRGAANEGFTVALEKVALASLLGWDSRSSLESAYESFKNLAESGNPRGQFGLGFLYASGLFLNSSVPHALVYFTFAALGGDHLANMALGYRYWAGIGVEEDCEAALTHYYRVAQVVFKEVSKRTETGGPTLLGPMVRRARLIDEVDMLTGSDVSNGDLAISEDLFQYYQFMADKKNISAMVGLGQLYYYGRHGVEMDHSKAFSYFTLAAESGSSLAMAYLGEMFMVGFEEIPPDPVKALLYLRKSAEDNNPIGQTGLALAYLYGRAGLPVKPLTALELFLKAADQGWAEAQLHLGRLFLGTSNVKADYKLALKYFTLASQQGNTLAFYHLGEMHAQGTGVIRSCSTATELFKNVAERGRWSKLFMNAYSAFRNRRYYEAFVTYQLLAELGYEVAQSNVAFILEDGKAPGIPLGEIYSRAFTQWQRSASQGSTSSRVKLGDYFYYGFGTDVSYTKAIQQYRIASELHHDAQAMFNLAYMHEQGLGLKRDLHLAKRFYDMAAEASIDARIAVLLALTRLTIYFAMEFFGESHLFKIFGRMFSKSEDSSLTSSTFSSDSNQITAETDVSNRMDWDFYAIPILAGLLLILLVYMRHRRE